MTVPMHEVARRAGVARTAVAHFVGDHQDLQEAAVDELRRKYEDTIRTATGSEPRAHDMVDFLFTYEWATERTPDDLAFDHFVLASMTNPSVAQAVRATYELLTRELAAAIARDHPSLHPDQADATAYSIVCLAEFNTTLQRLGFPPRRSHDAHTIARHLLHDLDDTASANNHRDGV